MRVERYRGLARVTAVILAGGLGTRLRTVVKDRSKTMATVHGRPFLTYLFDQLSAAGIREAVLCTGYMGDQVRKELGATYNGLRLRYSQEETPLGTAGAVRLAMPLVSSESILVMNGDSYCSADLNKYWETHGRLGYEGSLLLTQVPDVSRYGSVKTSPGNRVLSFEEKGAATGPGWINAGIYLFDRQMLEGIPQGTAVSMEREMWPQWIQRGVGAHHAEARFLDIGTPESYAETERFFAPLLQTA